MGKPPPFSPYALDLHSVDVNVEELARPVSNVSCDAILDAVIAASETNCLAGLKLIDGLLVGQDA
jgi:hypothetical protein